MTDIVQSIRNLLNAYPLGDSGWPLDTLKEAADEIERLRKALRDIKDHWACSYDHRYANTEAYRGSYGIGIVDGHRAAAIIASAALEAQAPAQSGEANPPPQGSAP